MARDPGLTPPGPDAAVYVISVAAELTGLHPQTLRAYERMGLITPGRTGGGGRRYSHRDIELLREIAELTVVRHRHRGRPPDPRAREPGRRRCGCATRSSAPSSRRPARRCVRPCLGAPSTGPSTAPPTGFPCCDSR